MIGQDTNRKFDNFQERAIKNFSQADTEYGETIRKLIETKYNKNANVMQFDGCNVIFYVGKNF